MQLNSEKVAVNATPEIILNFLKDARNLNELLPQDAIKDFEADENQCSFKVQGGFTISLVEDGIDGNNLFLKSGEKTPFPFRLTVHLAEMNEKTEGFIEFDGEVNAFLKMMVEKPLLNLFNYMSRKLKEKYD